MAKLSKFTLTEYKFCSFDIEIEYASTYTPSTDQKTPQFRSEHKVTIRNSVSGIASAQNIKTEKKVTNECLPTNVAISIDVNSD